MCVEYLKNEAEITRLQEIQTQLKEQISNLVPNDTTLRFTNRGTHKIVLNYHDIRSVLNKKAIEKDYPFSQYPELYSTPHISATKCKSNKGLPEDVYNRYKKTEHIFSIKVIEHD